MYLCLCEYIAIGIYARITCVLVNKYMQVDQLLKLLLVAIETGHGDEFSANKQCLPKWPLFHGWWLLSALFIAVVV